MAPVHGLRPGKWILLVACAQTLLCSSVLGRNRIKFSIAKKISGLVHQRLRNSRISPSPLVGRMVEGGKSVDCSRRSLRLCAERMQDRGPDESTKDEAKECVGQVTTSYSEVLKVLFKLEDIPDAIWEERRTQLEAAKAVALKAEEFEDVEKLRKQLEEPKEGSVEMLCVIRKLLKKVQMKIMVGDRVFVNSIDWVQSSGMVTDVMERNMELVEPKVANVDLALLVFALANPDPSIELMTRFTVSLTKAGIPFIIILNKADSVEESVARSWKERIEKWGHAAACVSVKSSEGLDQLRETLKGRVTVLCGPSGVGKSSIINWMLTDGSSNSVDIDVAGKGGRGRVRGRSSDEVVKNQGLQSVQSVSSRSGSGKQTTRTVSLLRLPGGGLLADTPGFSKATLQNIRVTDLSSCFPEIMIPVREKGCKFSDCKHMGEPGCSVGNEWERYQLYVDLREELEEEEEIMRKKGKFRTASENVEKRKDSKKGKRMEFKLKSKRYRKENRKTARQNMGEEFS